MQKFATDVCAFSASGSRLWLSLACVTLPPFRVGFIDLALVVVLSVCFAVCVAYGLRRQGLGHKEKTVPIQEAAKPGRAAGC